MSAPASIPGDSIAVYPAWNLDGKTTEDLIAYTKNLALGLNTRGLVNIQYMSCMKTQSM